MKSPGFGVIGPHSVAGNRVWVSGRIANALNCWAIAPAHDLTFYFIITGSREAQTSSNSLCSWEWSWPSDSLLSRQVPCYFKENNLLFLWLRLGLLVGLNSVFCLIYLLQILQYNFPHSIGNLCTEATVPCHRNKRYLVSRKESAVCWLSGQPGLLQWPRLSPVSGPLTAIDIPWYAHTHSPHPTLQINLLVRNACFTERTCCSSWTWQGAVGTSHYGVQLRNWISI